jgi:hypothetical protein
MNELALAILLGLLAFCIFKILQLRGRLEDVQDRLEMLKSLINRESR